MNLVVKGKMVTPKGLTEGFILIEDGVISKIGRGEIQGRTDEVLDCRSTDCLILPGLMDIHVHMRDFEFSYKEDFWSGTRAAAKGGFTVVADIPNTRPRTNTRPLLKEKNSIARGKAVVDYCLYYGVPEDPHQLTEKVKELAVGIKLYMVEEFYSPMKPLTMSALGYAAGKELLVTVHAENPSYFLHTSEGTVRTPEAGASAIAEACDLSSRLGFRLHVPHVSSTAGLNELSRWRGRLDFTAETCPHYFLLNEKTVGTRGLAKVYPPIRGSVDTRAILEAVRAGRLEAIASDHAPHTLSEKTVDYDEVKPGFLGLETTLPLLLTLVDKNLLTLDDVVKFCYTNPSKILGIISAGAIKEGKVGNLTVVDPHKKHRVRSENFESKAKFSPFEGREVVGEAVATIVRGAPVMLEGEVTGKKGWGINAKNYR